MQLIDTLKKFPYVVILLLVAAISFATLNSDFLFIDDTILIVNNPQIHLSMANLLSVITKPLGQIFDAEDYPFLFIYYRPALSLYYMLNNILWGINPVGFHISNLLLHFFTTILIYRTALLLFDCNKGLSLLVAALFCVHPAHNELIGRVAMNENLLGFFMAASFYFYLKGRRSLSLVAFSLALLSKESAIMLPFVLLVFELRKQTVKDALRYMAPYVALMAVYLLVRTIIVGTSDGFDVSLESLLSIPVAMATYLRLLFMPYPLNIFYPTWKFVSPFQEDLLLSVSILLLIGCLLWRLKDEKLAASLLLGIIVLLAPVALKANEMILGADRAFIAERQLYVPAIFFALLIPEIIRKFKHLQQSKYLSAALIGVIALFIYLSHTTNVVWANSEVLTDRFIKNYPNSQVSNITLGNKLLAKGDTAGALEEFKKALPAAKEKVLPKNDKIHREAPVKKFKNLAALLDKYNIAAYQPAYASVHYHIGRVYLAKNDLETAQRKFKTVLVLQPHFVEARVALARIYMEKRLFPDASREYKLALKDIEVFRVP